MPPFPWVSRCLFLFLSITINNVYCLNVSIFNIEITFFSVSINISIFPFIEECFIFLQTFVPMKVLANRNRNIQQIPTYILNSWALNMGNNILWINIYQILVTSWRARRCPWKKKKFWKKKFGFFLAYVTPRPPLSVHKKFQLNRSSRLAGYREHIYECLVLLYRRCITLDRLKERWISVQHIYEEQIPVLIDFVCPDFEDVSGCETGVNTWWEGIG